MRTPEQALDQAIEFLRYEVKPRAQEIDQDPEAVRWALARMGELEIMALKRPVEYGGPGMPEPLFRRFQEETARVSGTLAFLQTQHQSAVSMISNSGNEDLKRGTLPLMADGRLQIGIGFSQLRRSGPPIFTATPQGDGSYLLNGHVPWATGFGFYDKVLIAAQLPDGEAVFGLIPFSPVEGIRFSEPMALASMGCAMTVAADLENWLLTPDQVAFTRPAGWIQNNDEINIALQGHFAIGCALGSLDVIEAALAKKPLEFIHQAHAALSAEVEEMRAATTAAQDGGREVDRLERLRVRAWAIDLAVRCAHAAIVASSGAANSLQHPAQRLYREALVYTVSAQTIAVMEATLARLSRR